MRFVAVRSLMNQATLMRHKTREMLVSQRTQLLNGLRGHLTELVVQLRNLDEAIARLDRIIAKLA